MDPPSPPMTESFRKILKIPKHLAEDLQHLNEEQIDMTSHVFPALYINLGAEMMYVLDQRLRVQKERIEDREKSDKVVKEIMMGFLAKKTLDEVFKGHGIPTRSGLKVFFEKIAHCSIMRLNENSMDKLFDLMMMSYKFCLMKMTMPEQIMTITVNHLRALLDLVPLDKEIGNAVEHAYTMTFTFYRPLGPMGFFMLRNSLLSFFQDSRVKVSTFLKDSKQLQNGRFVVYDKNVPIQLMIGGQPVGLTKYFSPTGEVTHTSEFPTVYKYEEFEVYPDALDAPKRSTDLGGNNYRDGNGLLKVRNQLSGGGLGKPDPRREGDEMAFFESMMSAAPAPSAEGDEEIWGMSLFDNIEDEKRYAKEVEASQQVTVIDAREKKKSLKAAMEDMQIDAKRPPTSAGEKKKKTKGANMLDLLDEAVARPATAKKGTKAKRSESIGAKTTTAPKSDDPAKPRTRSGSRPTTANRPATKSEGRAEARPPTKSDSRPGTKNGGASRPATKSATRPTTASRPASKSTERAGSAAPKRAGSAKKKSVVPEQAS
ncbi:hypothetical protein L5515_003127 [Caenorhabditis briggsae]|uniref:Protein OSCP1 n=1 Tax=Caenorhabditis briggsae TaxID=6238 RepID=A0AAE9EI83_CAEBR|nr:hypothetical protein L5515_003127 [Caenorhabditis briggsae]